MRNMNPVSSAVIDLKLYLLLSIPPSVSTSLLSHALINAPATNWRKLLLVNRSTRAWKTPRIQATPECTFGSSAHARCRVLRTVPHYHQSKLAHHQSKLAHRVCRRRRARAITHIQSTENTSLLQTSSSIQRLRHDFTTPKHFNTP